MRIGASLSLIALGAILKFAITTHLTWINVQATGVILMVVGILGLAFELAMLAYRRHTTTVVTQRPHVGYADPPTRRIERY